MKILYITPYYKPSWYYGGPPKCIAEQAGYLAQHAGICVDVLTLNVNGDSILYQPVSLIHKREVDGVTVHYLPVSTSSAGKKYFYSAQLKSFIESFEKYDLVHVHTLFNYFSKEGMQFAIKNNIPLAVTPHGMLDRFSLTRTAWVKKIHRFIYDNRLLTKAKFVQFTTSSELSNSVVPSGINPVIVPIGFNFNSSFEIIDKENAFAVNSREKNFKLIFLGRINRKKGLALLLKAMSKLNYEIKQKVYLDIFGEDDDNHLNELMAMKEEFYLKNVAFRGKLDPNQGDAEMAKYDCLVLTSYQENFGLVVVEALERGKPVLISDKVNLADFIQKYECGWVTELDEAAISSHIEKIYKTPEQTRSAAGARGALAVKQNFSLKEVTKQLLQAYFTATGQADAA